MAETIVLDPTAVATGRTQLDLTSYVAAAGPNWGDAEITAYMADQAVGSSPVDYRLPNRQISIPLSLRALGATTFATIRSSLQQKIALFQRQRGWIMRQVGATPLYADVVNATLHLGGAWLAAYRDIDIDAVLTLECIPDFYGDEITLSDHVETTLPHLLFTEPTVNGNHPGRVRLVVDNDQAVDQHGLLWGFRASNYNAGTTAALFYEAESLLAINGAAGTALAGASGGTVIAHTALPASTWVSMLRLSMTAGTTALTHTGSYRVWARCYSATATPQYRLQWGVGDLAVPATNDPMRLAGTANFYLLDLGGISLDPPPVGSMRWQGVIQTQVPASNQPAMIDSVYLQPLDDTAGRLTYVSTNPASSIEMTGSPATVANDATTGTVDWTNPTNATVEDGSYATMSTSGAQTSKWLKATNYFAIPSTATILGIQVLMYCQRNVPSAAVPVRLVKAGTIQAGLSTTFTEGAWGVDVVPEYGGPTDLWGAAWTASDINNSGFGCAVQLVGASGANSLNVNYLEMIVWYTLASGFTVAQDAVAYASQSVQVATTGMYREDPTGTVWGPVSSVVGDLPRIPPSGLEGGTIQTFLKMSRGDFAYLPDAGIDDISARIFYRPSYLITP